MADDRLLIDTEHPWPWLEAFPEYAEQFFNGREKDEEALLRCVLAATVSVLFGKSGLGKSSLLQAGLFPRLRNERLLPVYVRLNHEKDSASAAAQITKRLQEEIQGTQGPSNAYSPLAYYARQETSSDANPAVAFSDSLWTELHRADIELRDAEGRRWAPVFVLDQFEEIFTLGAIDPERQKQVFYELGDLMENRIPKTLAERLHSDDELFDRLNLDVQHYRFLLSIREDYLPDLEEWTDLFPRLGPNRYRLLPMSDLQAIAAVEETGGTLLTHDDAVNIVHYLSQTQASSESAAHRRRAKAQIEPALLSLMCSGLNAKRLDAKKPRLETGNLAKEGGFIVEHFYDEAFAGLPESARDFVEGHLITNDGVRLPYPVRSVIAEKLATAEQINTLVNKRLLRRESLEEGDRIELVHDRLAQVTLQRRQESQQRKEALKQQRVRLRWRIGAAVIVVLLALFAGFMAKEKRKTTVAWMEATAMRLVIEGGNIISGSRPGGQELGQLKLLAAHSLSRSINTEEALKSEHLRTNRLVFLRKDTEAIISVAFSPDGKRIVSGSEDNTLRLWDAETGKPIGQPLKGHTAVIEVIAFSPDGKLIASSSDDQTLRLWDAETGKPIGEPLEGHTDAVVGVAFSPDGKRIVSGSWDKTLRLWDVETGASIGEPLKGHEDRVRLVDFSPDGKRIVSGSDDATLGIWNAETGKLIVKLPGHKGSVMSVAFSPDGKRIVSGSYDRTLRLWDAETHKPISDVQFKGDEKPDNRAASGQPAAAHIGSVSKVVFSRDGRYIASGSDDKTVKIWDAKTGESIGQPFKGHNDRVSDIAFQPNGNRIVSVSEDKTLQLWNVRSGEDKNEPLTGHEYAVLSVAFSPDGKRIVSGSSDKTLRLWDAETGKSVGQPLKGHEDDVYGVAFSPDGQRIVSGSTDKTLRLWDAETGAALGQPLKGHEDDVYGVAFSPDGKRIVSGGRDKTLRLWDAETGKHIGKPLTGPEYAVLSVAFSPDGKRIVSGSDDKTLRLWDAETGKPIGQPLEGHEYAVTSVAFSPDGKRIVSGSADNTLRLWDVGNGAAIGQPLEGHEGYVYSVAFSPDGKRIASASWDRTLRLWDAETGKPIGQPLDGHEGSVRSVAFSPDGRRIVSGSDDKTLRLWPIFQGWADELCKKLGRNMSHKEWREWVSPEIDYIEQCPGLPIPPDEPASGPTAEQANQP